MPEETGSARSSSKQQREPRPYRAGFVAIVGLPNVGKSTILNRLVGVRLAAVTAKAQTTRRRLLGIYSDESHQAVFIDTPGLLEPRYLLQAAMAEEASGALADADVLVYVVDAGYRRSAEHGLEFGKPARAVGVLCLNKMDRVSQGEQKRLLEAFRGSAWSTVMSTIATEDVGVEALRSVILSSLPESPPRGLRNP